MPPRASPWGRPAAPTSGPSSSAFPDLAAAQKVATTRRARAQRAPWDADAFNPYPSRAEELNTRASAWRRAGRRAQAVVFRNDEAIEQEARCDDDAQETHSYGHTSVVVRDATPSAAIGAWACMWDDSSHAAHGTGVAAGLHHAQSADLAHAAPAAAERVQMGVSRASADGPARDAPPQPTHARSHACADAAVCRVPVYAEDPHETPLLATGAAPHATGDHVLAEALAAARRAQHAEAAAERMADTCYPRGGSPPRAEAAASSSTVAYAPVLALVTTWAASPILLYRTASDAFFALFASGALPNYVRDELRVRTNAALSDFVEVMVQAAATPGWAGFTSRFDASLRADAAQCAFLALELASYVSPVCVEHVAEQLPRAAWAAPTALLGDAVPFARLARVVDELSSGVSRRWARHPAAAAHAASGDMLLLALSALRIVNDARPVERLPAARFSVAATELPWIMDAYLAWLRHCPSVCDVSWALTLNAKIHIVAWEAQTAMRRASHHAFVHELYADRCAAATARELAAQVGASSGRGGVEQSGSLYVAVRRDAIVADSLAALGPARPTRELHRPLKVAFVGEDAQDTGGLRKEWLLVLCEALQADTALWVDAGETEPSMRGQLWFARPSGKSHDTLERLELLGTALALALFHQLAVPLRLARAVYVLLLAGVQGEPMPCTLDTLALVQPALAMGLAQLLAFDERAEGVSVADAMHVTWSVAQPHGPPVDLVPGGASRRVTCENRAAYVERMCSWALVDAVREPLDALVRGFARVAGGGRTPLALLTPSELETLLCGRDERALDIDALRASTAQVGYAADDAAAAANLDAFWATWAALAPAEQHALLGFITGCPRVPAMGPAAIGLRIQHVDDPYARLGAARRIPWSSTCTSTLFLPVYASRDELAERVRVALRHSMGFGLV